MGLILAAEALRVVNRNDRGIVTYRKRYKKGDEVDVSKMEKAHVENLKEEGSLVDSEDDLSENTNPRSPAVPEPEVPEKEPEDRYESMDYAALRSEASSRDISAGGSAEDIRSRLREADQA